MSAKKKETLIPIRFDLHNMAIKYSIPPCPIDSEHVFTMSWDNAEDMKTFLDNFVLPNALKFGFEVTYTKTESKTSHAPKSVRV